MVPAGTPVSAPVSTTVPVPVGTVVKVTIVIPPGHAGLTGLQVLLAGTPIIPYAGAAYLIGDNYQDSWEIGQDVNPGNLTLAGYNTDIFQHTFYTRFLWQDASAVAAVTGPPAGGTAGTADIGQLGAYAGDEDLGDEDLGDEDLGDEDLGDEDLGDVTAPEVTSSVPACYDINGNVVDCGSPDAVSGPVTYVAPAAPAAPAPAPDTEPVIPDVAAPAAPAPVMAPAPVAVLAPTVTAPPNVAVPAPAPAPPTGTAASKAATKGPYRQIATGKLSLDQIAADFHTTAHDIVETTRGAHGMTRAEITAFNHYVDSGATRKMPKGLAFYTATK
jgi:hypothetical protein